MKLSLANSTQPPKLLGSLSSILELAVEYAHVERNVAHGKRRRIKVISPERCYINRADHLSALLDGAAKQPAKAGTARLPDGLTPQSLRRTFASLLFAVGESPAHVKGQLGHTDAALTLNYYAREMDRRDGEPERLKALVSGEIKADKGSNGVPALTDPEAEIATKPLESGILRP